MIKVVYDSLTFCKNSSGKKNCFEVNMMGMMSFVWKRVQVKVSSGRFFGKSLLLPNIKWVNHNLHFKKYLYRLH